MRNIIISGKVKEDVLRSIVTDTVIIVAVSNLYQQIVSNEVSFEVGVSNDGTTAFFGNIDTIYLSVQEGFIVDSLTLRNEQNRELYHVDLGVENQGDFTNSSGIYQINTLRIELI